MKKYLFIVLSLLVFSGLLYSQEVQSVTIVNKTGDIINSMFVKQVDSDSWGDNILPFSTLNSPAQREIAWPYPINATVRFDIKLTDRYGYSYIKLNVLVRANGEIIFDLEDLE